MTGLTIVRAAGGVVWRAAEHRDSSHRLLVVHRPRHDDWSLPKGKREPGESDEQCAVREIYEEAGVIASLGAELLPTRYVDHRGRDKVVRWWTMTAVVERPFVPAAEVDERRWVTLEELARLATYRADVERAEMARRLLG